MKLFTFSLFLFITLLSLVYGQQDEDAIVEETDVDINSIYKDTSILTLTDLTFDEIINNHHLVLVQYYAPWCGYCKALAPEFKEAADTLINKEGISVAKINCMDHEDVCVEHGVQSYPTLVVFKNGSPTTYKGPRTASSIVSFMKRQNLPKVTLLTSLEDDTFQDFIQSDDLVIVGYGSIQEKEKENKQDDDDDDIIKEEEEHDDDKEQTNYVFFYNAAKELYTNYRFGFMEMKGKNGFMIYKKNNSNNDNGQVEKIYEERFDKILSTEDFIQLIQQQALPLVGEIGPDNFIEYEEAALPIGYLFIDSKDSLDALLPDYRAVAQHYKGKISFVYIDALLYPEQAGYLGLTTEEEEEENNNNKPLWPAFVIQDQIKGRFVLPQGSALTTSSLEQYIDAYLQDELTPYFDSDPIPEKNDGPVKVIVGSQYNELITQADQDVLIEFYAPWCGHCKALAPIWTRLGELVQEQHYPSLMIAKMDATTNEIPLNDPAHVDVDGYPMIAFIEAKTHRIAVYDGNQTLVDLVEFIHEQKAIQSLFGQKQQHFLQLSDEDLIKSYTPPLEEHDDDDQEDDNDGEEKEKDHVVQEEEVPIDTFDSDDVLGDILKKEKDDQRIINHHDEL
ncbi:thioredoxin-like protein [Cunninghamella echinulata]|nr:thioredoxin-like protein [Cunninghamella echinulata]